MSKSRRMVGAAGVIVTGFGLFFEFCFSEREREKPRMRREDRQPDRQQEKKRRKEEREVESDESY